MTWPISGDDVRQALKNANPATASDEELDRWALVAMGRIEQEIGPRRGQTAVWDTTVDYWWREQVLPHEAASVASITLAGRTWDYLEFRGPCYIAARWPYLAHPGHLVVEWTAPTTVPAEVEEAAITFAAFIARQRKVGINRPGNPAVETPQGFAIPNAVMELLGRLPEPGGFA